MDVNAWFSLHENRSHLQTYILTVGDRSSGNTNVHAYARSIFLNIHIYKYIWAHHPALTLILISPRMAQFSHDDCSCCLRLRGNWAHPYGHLYVVGLSKHRIFLISSLYTDKLLLTFLGYKFQNTTKSKNKITPQDKSIFKRIISVSGSFFG